MAFATIWFVSDDQTQRFNALLESIDSKFDALHEGHEALRETFMVEMGGVKDRLGRVETRLDTMTVELASHGKRLDRVESRLDTMTVELESQGKRLGGIEHHLELNGVPSKRRPRASARRRPRKK